MWTASVVFLLISVVLLAISAVMTIWPHSRQAAFGWVGLFFLALAFFVTQSHVFGWS